MTVECETCGGSGISPPNPECWWCNRPAVAYCDTWLGCEKRIAIYTHNDKPFTCDAPMCSFHRSVVGFLCGDESDFIDACPVHAQHDPVWRDVTDENEANAIRSEIQAGEIKNKELRKIFTLPI